VVPLDMFPSGLLENVTTSKTFTPDQQGDFSGAQVDIKTREFPARRSMSFAVTTGYNPDATGKSILTAARAGGEHFANVGSKRNLPGTIRALGNFENIPLNQGDINRLVGMFRNSWSPELSSAPPNLSTSFSLGGNDPLLFGHRVGYLISGTYANTREIETDQVRAFANRGTTPGSTIETDRFEGETGNVGVLWGGLTNLSTVLGTHSRISLNNTYSRTADNEARSEVGDLENEAIRVRIDRMQYVERAVRSSQAAGEHQLGEANKFDWAVTSSAVRRDEPDRSEFVSVVESGTGTNEVLRWLNASNQGAVRTFSELNEDALEYRGNYQLNFSALGRQHFVKVGGLHRSTDRDADTRAYSISAPAADDATRALRPEQLFDGRFTTPQSALFDLDALSQGGAYTASDELSAGYIMTELALSNRFRLIGGARYERDELAVDAVSTLGNPARAEKEWTDVLPSVALNVQLSDAQNLRISYARTLARPEYRELSPIKTRDVLNGDNLEGNPDLQRTRIQNADVRWEWYPTSGEAVTVGVFAKQFDDPIERVYRAGGASSRFVAFVNAEEATNYGIEVEVRKNLGFLNERFVPLSLFSNVTLMESSIELGSAQSAATNSERRMVGQAPYVLNVGLAYATGSGNTSATLLFNRVGERIEAAGDQPLPDVIQTPRNVLDFSLRFPIAGAVSGRLDAKNLLDAPFETVQGTVTRDYWKVGRVVQVGLLFRP
jgi:TonB-dependent receptor